VELRHLRYFVALAEEMNFRRAAERLHIATPALSVQMRNLEAEVGTPLVVREGRGSQLTDAGRVFLERARQTLACAQQGIVAARRAANGEIGHIAIGHSTGAELRVFPKLMPEFRKRWPDVQLTFHELKLAQQLHDLRSREIDVGFIWSPQAIDEFDTHELTREPLVAALPSNHRLASAPSVSIKDLSHEPLVFIPRRLDPESYHQVEELFHRAHAVMNVIYELDSTLSLINFIAMQAGCSVLPQYTRLIPVKGVVFKPLRGIGGGKCLAIIKRKDTHGIAEIFFRFTARHFPLVDAQGADR